MAARSGRPVLRLVPLSREKAETMRQDVLVWAHEAPELAAEMLALIDRRTASSNAWRFVMVGAIQNRDVVRWIVKHARRAATSHVLWAEMKANMHTGTNEVMMSRAHMMQATGAPSPHVSEALSELVRIGAIERRKEGRETRWFVSARVATHLSGVARDEAQRIAPPLLPLMQDSIRQS